jgi:predicted RNA binding protein YcfA (HicA-like mRNA interferase family)
VGAFCCSDRKRRLALNTDRCNSSLVKRRDLERELRDLGWSLVRNGSRHDIWGKGEGEFAVPRHNEINEYTAKAILREAKGVR